SDLENWYIWDGHGFARQFVDPYKRVIPESERFCAPIDAGFRTRSVMYSPEFQTYIIVTSRNDASSSTGRSYHYATSPDLIHWSRVVWLRDMKPSESVPSVIDHTSPSRNFDTVGRNPYLYIGRDIPRGELAGESAPTGEVWREQLTISPRPGSTNETPYTRETALRELDRIVQLLRSLFELVPVRGY
ncbi:MAG TPA: hypothetical protein VJB97_04735, partial [Candidatus Paceibacterota bacterium]